MLLTDAPRFAVHGVRPTMSVAALRRRVGRVVAVSRGREVWFFAPAKSTWLAFRARRGRVLEVGIADRRLTATADVRRRFPTAWPREP